MASGAHCSYNLARYGRVYNWYAVDDSSNIAPEGWHVPTDAEWDILVECLGGRLVAGGKMKEIGGWSEPNTGATNESGFTARPGGYCSSFGSFYAVTDNACFWSSTAASSRRGWHRYLNYGNTYVRREGSNKEVGFSVRCVRD